MPTTRKHLSNAQRQRAYRVRQQTARVTEFQAKGLLPRTSIPSMPSTARWNALIQMAQDLLGTAPREMEAYRDDRSEAWQESVKGESLQEILDRLDEALDSLAENR